MTESEILAHILNACNPAKPATDKQYVNCSDVRGSSLFAENLCEEFTNSDEPIHALFTGHIGCGKSSELQHIADNLDCRTPRGGQKRFFPIIVNMSEYLDDFDVDVTDILLAVITETADALRTRESIEVSDSWLTSRWDELKEFVTTDLDIREGDINIPWGKIKVQRLRIDPTARRTVREKLLPQTKSFLEEINLAFVAARTRLKLCKPREGGAQYTDFVLILDNLEKIERFAGNPKGLESQRALFVEGAHQLTALSAHAIYTIPLSLFRRDPGVLEERYSKHLFSLPMVKTQQRGREHHPYPDGLQKLELILQRRMPLGVALADVFAPDALAFLVEYSGGHVRNLIMYAREASLYARKKLPITLESVQRSMAQTVGILAPSLSSEDWDFLAQLEVSRRQQWNTKNAEQSRLLENLSVMEYINGGNEEILERGKPWYAVNPILRVQDEFEDAVADAEEAIADAEAARAAARAARAAL